MFFQEKFLFCLLDRSRIKINNGHHHSTTNLFQLYDFIIVVLLWFVGRTTPSQMRFASKVSTHKS